MEKDGRNSWKWEKSSCEGFHGQLFAKPVKKKGLMDTYGLMEDRLQAIVQWEGNIINY